jgi:hypothetical protein
MTPCLQRRRHQDRMRRMSGMLRVCVKDGRKGFERWCDRRGRLKRIRCSRGIRPGSIRSTERLHDGRQTDCLSGFHCRRPLPRCSCLLIRFGSWDMLLRWNDDDHRTRVRLAIMGLLCPLVMRHKDGSLELFLQEIHIGVVESTDHTLACSLTTADDDTRSFQQSSRDQTALLPENSPNSSDPRQAPSRPQ